MYFVCMGIVLHWKDESFHIKHFVNVFRLRFRFVIYNRYVEGLAIKIWYVNCTSQQQLTRCRWAYYYSYVIKNTVKSEAYRLNFTRFHFSETSCRLYIGFKHFYMIQTIEITRIVTRFPGVLGNSLYDLFWYRNIYLSILHNSQQGLNFRCVHFNVSSFKSHNL
jgi:hypothetical protein